MCTELGSFETNSLAVGARMSTWGAEAGLSLVFAVLHIRSLRILQYECVDVSPGGNDRDGYDAQKYTKLQIQTLRFLVAAP